jgi:hypothetical protein
MKNYPVKLAHGRRLYDWDKVDWSMKNWAIAALLGCSRQVVASKRCYRMDK